MLLCVCAVCRCVSRCRGAQPWGVAGFPTHVSKIRLGADGEKLEVVYSYEQRVFVRVSWERDDPRGRHVDFQCVRARAPAQLPAGPAS